MSVFLWEYLRNPWTVGAVAPSSRWLAAAMTREITPATGSVIELGPGTGVFTRALLAKGLPQYAMVLVEDHKPFAERLAVQLPYARVIYGNAGFVDLPKGAGAVVSGLPLRNMHFSMRVRILRRAFAALREGGALYQFTYGLSFPVDEESMAGLGLVATWQTMTLLNMPPATVWKVTRG